MAGLPQDAETVNRRVGMVALSVRNLMRDIQDLKVWIDGKTDQDLIAAGLTQGDVDVMRPAITDLDKLARICNGQATQAETNDFLFWARRLYGVA